MALREINLVPADILSHRQLRRHLCFWAGWMAISFALIFGFHIYQTNMAMAQKSPATNLKDIETQLASKIAEVKQIQEELEILNKKQAALATLTEDQVYSGILSRLTQMMNDYTWLTQLAINQGRGKDGNTNLQLTGFSSRNEELGDFLNLLSSEPLFEAVSLKYAREIKKKLPGQKAVEPVEMIHFQIDCNISRN